MAEFDVQNLQNQKPGSTTEKTLNGQYVKAPAGVYRHPQSGEEAICTWDPITGNAMAEAFMRVGFEWVREAQPDEITTMVQASIAEEQKKSMVNSNEDTLKGVLARLNAAEAELSRRNEADNATKSETEVSQDHAKDEAVRQTENRENVDLTSTDSGVNTPVEPQLDTTPKPKKVNTKVGK